MLTESVAKTDASLLRIRTTDLRSAESLAMLVERLLPCERRIVPERRTWPAQLHPSSCSSSMMTTILREGSLAQLFRKQGHQVTAAVNGETALNKAGADCASMSPCSICTCPTSAASTCWRNSKNSNPISKRLC